MKCEYDRIDRWPLFGSGDRAVAFSVLIYCVEQSAEKRAGRYSGKCGPQLESAACSRGRSEQGSWEPFGALRDFGWPGSLPCGLPCRPSSSPSSRRSLRHPRGAARRGEGFVGILTVQVLLSAWRPLISASFFLPAEPEPGFPSLIPITTPWELHRDGLLGQIYADSCSAQVWKRARPPGCSQSTAPRAPSVPSRGRVLCPPGEHAWHGDTSGGVGLVGLGMSASESRQCVPGRWAASSQHTDSRGQGSALQQCMASWQELVTGG